jgi:hypothetical protein
MGGTLAVMIVVSEAAGSLSERGASQMTITDTSAHCHGDHEDHRCDASR